MDLNPNTFKPDLNFALHLEDEDLKKKYFEQHTEAKKSLHRFSCHLENLYLAQQSKFIWLNIRVWLILP